MAEAFGERYPPGPGRPSLPTRLKAGLHILTFAFNLSDERRVSGHVRDPYFQYCCGTAFFQPVPPPDRSSLTRWRQRRGGEDVTELPRESPAASCRTGAAKPSDFGGMIADTTVQPKNIARPTDATQVFKASGRPAGRAGAARIRLRHGVARSIRRAPERYQACAHAHGKKCELADEQPEQPGSFPGSIIREIGRKIEDNCDWRKAFSEPPRVAERVTTQRPRDGAGRHVHAVHAPEVE